MIMKSASTATILMLILTSCTMQAGKAPVVQQPGAVEGPSIPARETPDEIKVLEQHALPCHPDVIIKNYGVPQEVVEEAMSINCEYFDGVKEIDWIKTKFDFTSNKFEAGFYIYDSGQIRMKYDPDAAGMWQAQYPMMKYTLIHELEHNWCWVNQHEVTSSHQGCFLDNPVRKQYGVH